MVKVINIYSGICGLVDG